MFEETIIFHYARHFHNAGSVYQEVGLYDDAIKEYERAITIDPTLKESLAALSRIYGEKLEKPDYPKAVEYLSRYVSVLKPGEEAYLQAAYEKMQEYDDKWQKQQEKMHKQLEKELPNNTTSTESAEVDDESDVKE
jgi:tetratricopeptide (TPR) repeat protein